MTLPIRKTHSTNTGKAYHSTARIDVIRTDTSRHILRSSETNLTERVSQLAQKAQHLKQLTKTLVDGTHSRDPSSYRMPIGSTGFVLTPSKKTEYSLTHE
jgi:hypothetical protein